MKGVLRSASFPPLVGERGREKGTHSTLDRKLVSKERSDQTNQRRREESIEKEGKGADHLELTKQVLFLRMVEIRIPLHPSLLTVPSYNNILSHLLILQTQGGTAARELT